MRLAYLYSSILSLLLGIVLLIFIWFFQVVVKFLLAPVNPADINTIQGVYPIKPKLPGVPGNEGVAEVVAVGSQVKDLLVGDRVVCNTQPASTWRTHALIKEADLFKVLLFPLLWKFSKGTFPISKSWQLRNFYALGPINFNLFLI